jgi:hypothetical protein
LFTQCEQLIPAVKGTIIGAAAAAAAAAAIDRCWFTDHWQLNPDCHVG